MREIKFRGKRKGEPHEWLIGDLHHFDGSVYIFPTSDEKELNSADWYEVNPETVGQYTGLKDKNDKGIWEGDIISDTSWGVPCKSYIFYNQDICAFQTRYHNINGQLVSNTIYSIDKKKFQVIGDIHNNPELLIP